MSDHRKLTQHDLFAEARELFGDDPRGWAFRCPKCGDVATGNDVSAALAEHPRTRRDGSPVGVSDVIGQECIGRLLGALEGPAPRGCDWVAYGLICGPWEVVLPDGGSMWAFPLAAARREGEGR